MRLATVLLAIAITLLTFTTAHAEASRPIPPYKLPSGASLVHQACPTDEFPGVGSIAFLANSPILVTRGAGTRLKLWNIQSGRLIKEISGVDSFGVSMAPSPAGAVMAVPSGHTIKLWDLNTGQILRTFLQEPNRDTTAIAFDNTGRLLISSDVDLTGVISAVNTPPSAIRIWDPLKGEIIKTLGVQHDVQSVAFSPDGKLALAAGQYITVWDVATGSLVNKFDTHMDDFGNPLNAVFSPDGTYVVAGGHSDMAQEPALTLWDVKTGQIIRAVNGKASTHPIAFSADKHSLLAAVGRNALQLWNVSNWALEKTLGNGDETKGRNTRFTTDGSSVATISDWCEVQVWKIDTGRLLETLYSPTNGWASYTPDGWFVSSGNPEQQFKLLRRNQALAIKPLIQRNRLDTLAAVNGLPDGSFPQTDCRDSKFPLGKLICDDGRLGKKPAQITDASAYFTVVQTAQSTADAQRRLSGLMTRFPFERFNVFPPYADENKWMIVVASYTDVDRANEAGDLARRLGIAENPNVWKIPDPARVPEGWIPENIQQVVMKCLAGGMQTILQMYTCSGSIVTPTLLRTCIKDGACELNLTPLAATQFLNSQKLNWNSPLLVQADLPDLKAVQTCLNARPNDANGFMDCSAQATLGTNSAAACRDKARDDRAFSECLLQAAGMNVGQLDCLFQKGRSDPSTCLATTNAPQWLQARQCLLEHDDPFDAAQSCVLTDVDPNALKMARCLSANHGRAADSLSCAAEWPTLDNQAKLVRCMTGIEKGDRALLDCGSIAGIHLDPTVSACLQSPSSDAANWMTKCLSGINNPAVACFSKFSGNSEDMMTCLANGNPTTRDALATVRCIMSQNDASDLIASCTEGLIKDPKARQAFACAARSAGNVGTLAGCAAAPLLGGEASRLLTCATQSQSYAALALCAAGPKMNQEWMIAAQCAASSGGVPVTTAACTAGWLTMRELGKCFEKGIGDDGCFGPNNTIVNAVNNAINDITKGPGPNNEIVKGIREIAQRTEIKDVSFRTPLGGRDAFIPKAGRDFDEAKNKAGKWLGARLGFH